MARTPKPTTAHKPNDFCTIAQADYIARRAIALHEAAKRAKRWDRRLRRWLVALFTRRSA